MFTTNARGRFSQDFEHGGNSLPRVSLSSGGLSLSETSPRLTAARGVRGLATGERERERGGREGGRERGCLQCV